MSTLNEDPTLERHFRGHKDAITALAFNPVASTKQLASSSLDSNLMIWNFRKSTRAFRFMGHKDAILDVSFSPTGNLVASASKDRTVRLWVPTVQGETGDMRAHTAAVRSVDFSPDGLQLLTSSDDKTVKLWSVSRRKFVSSFVGHNNWVRCARFSPEGRIIASCSDDKMVKLFDIQSGQCVHTFPETKGHALSVVFHPTGTCIGSAMSNNVIKVFDVRTFKLLQHYRSHQGPVNKLAFHPCGNYMISASQDSTMKVMDLLEGRPIYTLQGHEGPMTAVTFSGDGEYFASGGADEKILVWRTNFDREETRKESPRKRNTKIKESEVELNAPVLFQVDARRSVIGSSMPDIQVTDVEHTEVTTLDEAEKIPRTDENTREYGQSSAYGFTNNKSPKAKPHSVHTISSIPPPSLGNHTTNHPGDDGNQVEAGENLVAVVESLVKQVTLLKTTLEGVVKQQKLQEDKVLKVDAKINEVRQLIETLIVDSDSSIVE